VTGLLPALVVAGVCLAIIGLAVILGMRGVFLSEEQWAERDREERRRFREHEHQLSRRPKYCGGYLVYSCKVKGCSLASFVEDPDDPRWPRGHS
jgi:hypothetical protein